MVEAREVERVGLLATQGIRGGANRRMLERIKGVETSSWRGRTSLGWSRAPRCTCRSSASMTARSRSAPSTGSRGGHQRQPDERRRPHPCGGSPRTAVLLSWATPKVGRSTSRRRWRWRCSRRRTRTGAAMMWSCCPGSMASTSRADPRHVDHRFRDVDAYERPFEYVREHVRPTRIGNRRASYAEAGGCTWSPVRRCGRP